MKILFMDVDGTILSHSNNQVSPLTKKTIHNLRNQGVLVYICTGRHTVELSNMPLDDVEVDGYITLNGALCFNEKEIIHQTPISKASIQKTVSYVEKHPFPIQFMEKGRIWVNMYNQNYKDGLDCIHTAYDPISNLHDALEHSIYMMVPWANEDLLNPLLEQIQDVDSVRWNDYAVDCYDINTGKNAGVNAVLRYHNLSKDDAVAIGDGENDIPMFQACGISIAMDNANDTVKNHATYVTKSVDDEGFTHAFTKILNEI